MATLGASGTAPRRPVQIGRGIRVTFEPDDGFQAELRRRVDAYFENSGRRKRDCFAAYLKVGTILTTTAVAYVLLVFFAETWWQGIAAAVLLGLAMAGIGFNVQHDGGHQALSSRGWINRLAAMSLDLIGGSSYLWHRKHAVLHHTYVNVTDHDTDVDLGSLARLTPHQKRLPFHRWQHIYLWPLYGFVAVKWHFYDDFRDALLGRMGEQRFPRPIGRDLAAFLGGKLVFAVLAFGIPLLIHPVSLVAVYYCLVALVLGVALSVVFQLAHAVEGTEFPLPNPRSGRVEESWAIHQVETTMDFARNSRLLTWLLGGLNFQVEHHLFPRICHVHYPALAAIVEDTCREHEVRYAAHETFAAGVASHYRWLKRLGRPGDVPEKTFEEPLSESLENLEETLISGHSR